MIPNFFFWKGKTMYETQFQIKSGTKKAWPPHFQKHDYTPDMCYTQELLHLKFGY